MPPAADRLNRPLIVWIVIMFAAGVLLLVVDLQGLAFVPFAIAVGLTGWLVWLSIQRGRS